MEAILESKEKQGKGYDQLVEIIGEIMTEQKKLCSGRGFPKWDFVNGVLSCKEILGDKKLWFWFGQVRIVEPGQTVAGEMAILVDWFTTEEDDGTKVIELRGRMED